MDLTKIQLCRLCLQTNDDVVNIWDTYHDSTIASILTKHFWFQINKGDGLTEFICDVCWIQTKTFHQFYKQIEQFQKCFYDSVAKDRSAEPDAITYVDCGEKVMGTEFNIIKCEETELKPEPIDSQIGTCGGSEYEEIEIESESEDIADKEDAVQYLTNMRQKAAKKKSSPPTAKKGPRISRSEKAELIDRVCDLFNMNCEMCSDVKFQSFADAHQHYRNVHQRSGYLTCCGKRFNFIGQVLDHVRDHINLKANGPPEVEAQIIEWFAMKCDICTDTIEFQTLLGVRQHYRSVHNARGYLKGTCCDKKLYSRAAMLNHIRWHTNSDKLRCGQCDKIFSGAFALRVHIANHTPRDAREFKCTLCKSKFALPSALRAHIRTNHTMKTGEKFNCNKCTKSFQSSLLLSSHIRNIHESTTEYVCEICARTLSSKTALQNHFDFVHLSKPPPKVQCDICGLWVRRLDYHRQQIHEPANPMNCPICNKVKQNKKRLDYHVKYVHGDRSHKCQLCKKSFKSQNNLKEHLATHTGENLYDCPYCDKKFKSSGNFYNHKKNAHPTEWTRTSKGKKKWEKLRETSQLNQMLTSEFVP